MPLSKVLFDDTIELHLDIERVGIASRATIIDLLKALEKELIAKVANGVTDWSKSRIAKQLSEADALIRQYYDDAAGIARDTTTEVAQVSASATAQSLSVAVGGQVAIGTLPTAAYLETLAGNAIIQGAVQADWWTRQTGDTAFKFQSAVRQGLVGAETTPQIVRRVRDVMDVSKRNAETLVRTSVQSVANTAREKIFQDNSDVISGREWCAALDRRTCPVCGALDGKRWPLGSVTPNNPAHYSCRCSMVPVLKTWRELGINMDELPESTRASMDGQVSDKTFADWLKRKTEKEPGYADNVLGKGRAELWKNGKITLDQMIRGGKPMSLAQLKEKYKETTLKTMKVDKVVNALGSRIKQSETVADLWTSHKSFDSHVAKRIALGHITDAEDYRKKITKTITNADKYVIATGGNVDLMELQSQDWSVILNAHGEIKTAYKIEPDKPSFTENHKRLGYQVYENSISERIRTELSGLFGSR